MSQTLLKELEQVVTYNRSQVEKAGGDQGTAENLIEFSFGGMAIYDPYTEETGRFEVNPIDYYGKTNIKKMVKEFKNLAH